MKKELLEKYYKYKGFKSARSFAKALGISDSHISEMDKRPSNKTLELALRSKSEFSDLNLEWLENGEGSMIRESVKYDDSDHEEDNARCKPVTSDAGEQFSGLRSDQIDLLKKWDRIKDCRKRCAILALMDSMEEG